MSVEVPTTKSAAFACGLLLALMPALTAAQQDEHIFEPGKKHVCVPAKDRKGWDCGSSENPPPAAPKPDGPTLRSARAVDLEPAERAAAAAASEPPPAVAAPPATSTPVAAPSASAPSRSSRDVPNYLLAPGASPSPAVADEPPAEARPKATSAPASAVATAPAAEPVRAPEPVVAEPPKVAPAATAAPSVAAEPVVNPAPPPAPAPVAPATPVEKRPVVEAAPAVETPMPKRPVVENAQPRAEAKPVVEPAAPAPQAASEPVAAEPARTAPEPVAAPPAPAEPPRAASAPERSTAATGLQDAAAFRTLSDARYVLELARGADRATVEADAARATLPHGRVYLLPLQRDGASWYVALWGDFDSIESARAARSEALAAGVGDVGWPRRIGPLKQELRLVR